MEGRSHGRVQFLRLHRSEPAASVQPRSLDGPTRHSNMSAKFRAAGQIPVKRVETYVQDFTAYLRKHMGEALLQLETDGKLKVADDKTDGKKRRAKSFPNEALVTFL